MPRGIGNNTAFNYLYRFIVFGGNVKVKQRHPNKGRLR